MGYLNQRRGRTIVGCFLVSALILTAFPGIDIFFSSLFFHGQFLISDLKLQDKFRAGVTGFLALSMMLVVGAWLINKLLGRNLLGICGRKVCYLFLVLVVGAGLIVNVGLKDNFGRARPRDVAEFGGTKIFTPAFVPSRECTKNCSFSSGEGAAGFFSLALAFALSRRRATLAVAVGIGVGVSLIRIAAGAHYLSDTVVSFFVMLLVADVLHYYMRLAPGASEPVPEPAIPLAMPAALPSSDV